MRTTTLDYDRIVLMHVSAPPETIGRPTADHRRTVDGATLLRFNASADDMAWIAEIREAFHRCIFFPTEDLLIVNVECSYPRPKNHYDRKGRMRLDAPLEMEGGPCITAVFRAVVEACDGVVWKSRDQILRFSVRKQYVNELKEPKTLISVEKRQERPRTGRRGKPPSGGRGIIR